jgi:hypothetical protein
MDSGSYVAAHDRHAGSLREDWRRYLKCVNDVTYPKSYVTTNGKNQLTFEFNF